MQANRDSSRYMSWADVFIVVYDISNCHSFQFAERILKQIGCHEHSLCTRAHTVCLVGNKNDLEHYRVVSNGDASRLADEHAADFLEINCTSQYAIVKAVSRLHTFMPMRLLIQHSTSNLSSNIVTWLTYACLVVPPRDHGCRKSTDEGRDRSVTISSNVFEWLRGDQSVDGATEVAQYNRQ